MTVITAASAKGVAFVHAHEGRVLKAYRCPAGVVTIGDGFTMGSKVFAGYWREKHGRGLKMGDTITDAECDALLKRVLDEEYGRAVVGAVAPERQAHFDGSASVAYNCGTGALKWRWAKALAKGDVAGAAALLKTTAITANGRRLPGLVRRRADEAKLIRSGDYGGGPGTADAAVSNAAADVRWYQDALMRLGFYDGAIDGKPESSDAAVRAFQAKQDLTVDGVVGPATRAALIRALDAKAATRTTGTAAGGGAVVGGAGETVAPDPSTGVPHVDLDWHTLFSAGKWALIVAALVVIGFTLWRYRGLITGRRVPT